MNVRHFVKTDYPVTGPYTGTHFLKKQLLDHEAVVIKEDKSYIGVLTASDILKKPHTLAVDCLSAKPSVTHDADVNSVLALMQASKVDVLSVYNRDEFIGLVFKNDLLEYLKTSNEKLQHCVKERTVELETLNSQLEEQVEARTKEISELLDIRQKILAIIGHDLKDPMHNMLGFINLLKKNYLKYDAAKMEKYINILLFSAEKSIDLLDNLLTWSKSQSVGTSYFPEEINFAEIVNEKVENITALAFAKNITVTSEIDEELTVFADKYMLKTILRNFLINAIKFSNTDGHIKIRTVRRPGNFVEIRIQDNGIGMPEKIRESLFGPLPSGMPGTYNEKGTGFGLLICKDFIERHGGSVEIESIENQGTLVLFTLPCKPTPVH